MPEVSTTNQLVVGTDDEKALTQAVRNVFSGCKQALCTLHLKKNAVRHLRDKVGGLDVSQRNKLINSVFGTDGLAEAEDSIEFQLKKDNIARMWPQKDARYLEKMTTQLLKHSLELHWDGHLNIGWTNNNAESVNHVLKQLVQWKPQDLPQLVDKLHKLVTAQSNEIERAIIQRGELKLVDSLSYLALKPDVWLKMDAEKKKLARNKILKAPSAPSGHITSASGHLTVNGTPSKGRKPGQRKRPRAIRTQSSNEPISKKRREEASAVVRLDTKY